MAEPSASFAEDTFAETLRQGQRAFPQGRDWEVCFHAVGPLVIFAHSDCTNLTPAFDAHSEASLARAPWRAAVGWRPVTGSQQGVLPSTAGPSWLR